MTSKDYQKHLNRLKEEQQKAIHETDENIKQWEKFRSDYDALKKRLKTLPDKLSHDVMISMIHMMVTKADLKNSGNTLKVPLGKMGFMPGQLVHTNEILVLLGDNWFVERSAKQAADIVARRMIVVDEHLEDYRKQRKLLEPRQEFTDELKSMAEGGGDMVDITEEYDEEKEKLLKEKHRQNVIEHRKKMRRAKDQPENQQQALQQQQPQHQQQPQIQQQQPLKQQQQQQQQELTDAKLWERLDELERIELRDREMEHLDSEADSSHARDVQHSSTEENLKASIEKGSKEFPEKYSLSDDESDTSSRSLDSDDYDEDDEEEEEASPGDEALLTAKGKVIHFTHSKPQGDAGGAAEGGSSSISSPADLYSLVKPTGPVSILKKARSTNASRATRERREKKRLVAFNTGSDEEMEKHSPVKDSVTPVDLLKAFTGTVTEKAPSALPEPPAAVPRAPEKPVSQFKMRSANQNSGSGPPLAEKENFNGDSQATESVKPVSKFKAQRQKLNPP